MTYETIATLSQVTSLLMFIAMFARRRWPMPCGRRTGRASSEAQRSALDLDRKPSNRQGAHMTASKRHIDDVTGVETTGHEWDGVKSSTSRCPGGGS